MENSQKNLVKELAEQFINWMANDNNDTKNYAKMYGLVWSLLFIIGLWSSYNAAHADFSVLYGHYFNTTNNHSSSWWNALFIASFIQATILIPAGVILKILVNNLQKEAGEKGEKHIIQLCYLTPILLFGLVWSTRLSLNMDQAARAESYDNYKALLKQYDENTYKRDSVLLEINNQKTTSVNDNEKLLMEKFREDSLFQVQLYNSKKDSLTRRRNYLIKRHKETGSNWMIASANKIKSQKIPQLRNIRDVNIRQAKSQMTTTLLDSKLAIENSFKTEASTQDSIYSFTESKLEGFITTFEQDLKKNARKRKLMRIMFNLLADYRKFTSESTKENPVHLSPPIRLIPVLRTQTGYLCRI